MGERVLFLEGVFKNYGGDGTEVVTEVLKGVNLTVERGEFVALVGPSGSGKSTLLNILGLLDRPTRGRVMVAGEDTTRLDDSGMTRLRGRAIGFVFQFHHLLPGLTVLENVMMPMVAAAGRTHREMEGKALELLSRVGLETKSTARPETLSGGQRQRVAIARALVMEPGLVLADEPTGNLDTGTSDTVFALMREFNQRLGVAFVVVTHDLRLAGRCDRTVRLVDGEIVEDTGR